VPVPDVSPVDDVSVPVLVSTPEDTVDSAPDAYELVSEVVESTVLDTSGVETEPEPSVLPDESVPVPLGCVGASWAGGGACSDGSDAPGSDWSPAPVADCPLELHSWPTNTGPCAALDCFSLLLLAASRASLWSFFARFFSAARALAR